MKKDYFFKNSIRVNKFTHKPVKLAPLNLTHLLMNDSAKNSLRRDKNMQYILGGPEAMSGIFNDHEDTYYVGEDALR